MLPVIATTQDAMAALSGVFGPIADGMASDEYMLWLGSAVSRDRVADLSKIVVSVMDFLQSHQVEGDPDCAFGVALTRAIDLAELDDSARRAIDVNEAFEKWPSRDALIRKLVMHYSELLDIHVDGEEHDFLLWDVVDVRATFGRALRAADSEHVSIAVLSLEGAVSEIASGNWDGLIEQAFVELGYSVAQCLRVVVVADDLMGAPSPTYLFKFHGCAVRAEDDPATYRELLIANETQITAWPANPNFEQMRIRLTELASQRRSVFVGLSAQDSDIKSMFAHATASVSRAWNDSPAPYVVVGPDISPGQALVMKVAFQSEYHEHRAEIEAHAFVPMYAKPMLAAQALYVVFGKYEVFAERAALSSSATGLADALKFGVRAIRDVLSLRVGEARSGEFKDVALAISKLRQMYSSGSLPATGSYVPVSALRIDRLASDPTLSTQSEVGLGAMLGLIGQGILRGLWRAELVDGSGTASAVLRITSGPRSGMLRLVHSEHEAINLAKDGFLDMADESTVVLYNKPILSRPTRSGSRSVGRTGRSSAREVSLSDICGGTTSTDVLDRFRLAVAP